MDAFANSAGVVGLATSHDKVPVALSGYFTMPWNEHPPRGVQHRVSTPEHATSVKDGNLIDTLTAFHPSEAWCMAWHGSIPVRL